MIQSYHFLFSKMSPYISYILQSSSSALASSDKENSGINPNIWVHPEKCDPVFIEKEPESVCSEVSRGQPRSDKKVSFTAMTTVHDVTRK